MVQQPTPIERTCTCLFAARSCGSRTACCRKNDLFYSQPDALAVGPELRRIHALNGGNAIAEITTVRYKKRIFKNVCAFEQVIEKEVGACIFSAFIITKTALVFVSVQDVCRFDA